MGDFLKNKRVKKIFTTWVNQTYDSKPQEHNSIPISYYSLESLKESKEESSFSFFQCFKFYVLVSQTTWVQTNSNIRLLFLKWLKQKYTKTTFTNETITILLKYFQFLVKVLTKYKIIKKGLPQSSLPNELGNQKLTLDLSENQIKTIVGLYTKTVINSQLTVQLQLNSKLILVTEHLINWFLDVQNFSFLKQNIQKSLVKESNLNQFTQFTTFRPTLYFSTSLKDQLKYLFGQIHTPYEIDPTPFDKYKNNIRKRTKRLDQLIKNDATTVVIQAEKDLLKKDKKVLKEELARHDNYLKKRDKYLKSKTQLLLYQKDHEVKTNYHKKYADEELYTATLIPEYGSWIR